MKVFLTGGTGFIGQLLTRSLLARGWHIVALVRNPASPQAQALRSMGVQLVAGDITQRESMRAGMTAADMVIHSAGHYEFGLDAIGKQRAQQINVYGTENVLGLAFELSVSRTVYVSTVWAYGESGPEMRDETFVRIAGNRSVYEQTKIAAHLIAYQYQQRGLPLLIVCPNGVVGKNDHSVWGYLLRLYINNILPPLAWSPYSLSTLVEVHDLAEGIALVAEKGRTGDTYFLCGESKTLREHLEYWAEKPGRFRRRLWVPALVAELLFWPLEPLQRALGLPAFLSRETVRVGATNLNYSSEKAKHELGWTHKTARDMWLEIIDGERELLQKRRDQSLVMRLKPLDIGT